MFRPTHKQLNKINNATYINIIMKTPLFFLCLCLYLFLVSCKSAAPERKLPEEVTIIETTLTKTSTTKSLHQIIQETGVANKDLSLLIDKSDYTLTVLASEEVLKVYPVVFGENPVDDKLMAGDNATPEGTFYIRSKSPHQSWGKFICLNYPTADSEKKHQQAKQEGRIPKDAKMEEKIGIHGVPEHQVSKIANKQNWTQGSISLTNADIDEIYPHLDESTKIIIQQ